ncbi:hypothetical protein [Yoonia sp. SS1-5]|uniref:Uncharacterized protein n=1 Tax=Yoonia rhodophyticola TaxID=3137370 RepID=A0AAN0NHT1_9RHOB
MKVQTAICAVFAGPCWAENIACDMDGIALAFAIDRNQFVAPASPDEPPRRKVTMVSMGDAQFPAEPFLIGKTRGFWAEGWSGSDVIFVMQPDGSATYTDTRRDTRLTGHCEVRQ